MNAVLSNKQNVTYDIAKAVYHPRAFRCHLAITADGDGICSAVALNLPGVGSSGAFESEAIANAREAATGVIESCLDEGEQIPWVDETTYEIPDGANQKWILVNVESCCQLDRNSL